MCKNIDQHKNVFYYHLPRRWDKQQLIVDESGFMGICCEHSYADGTNWGRFIRETMNDALGKADPSGPLPTLLLHTAESAPAPEPLIFKASTDLEVKIAAADSNHTMFTSDLETAVLDFREFGKNDIKSWNCSPDGGKDLINMTCSQSIYLARIWSLRCIT
jgi:hypothetical protein